MTAEASVLSKKLRQSGVARSPLAETELIVDSFARGAEDRLRLLLKTIVRASIEKVGVTRLAEATGEIDGPALLGVVDIEDADTPALLACDADLSDSLIDLMLGGDPGEAPQPQARTLTAIDLALGRLHLDAILQAFAHGVGVGLGEPLNKRLEIRDLRQSLAQLRLAPDYIDVLQFDISLSLGESGRSGSLKFILPLSALDVIRASITARTQRTARERPNDLWKTLMRRAAAAAPVHLDGVLHRTNLSLAAIEALHPGDVLEIPRQAVEEIRLTMPQPGGRNAILAVGELGAYQNSKVIRLASEPDPRVAGHIVRALESSAVTEAQSSGNADVEDKEPGIQEPVQVANDPANIRTPSPGAEEVTLEST